MKRRMASILLSTLVLLGLALALPAVEAEREVSQPNKVSNPAQGVQVEMQTARAGNSELAFRVLTEPPESALAAAGPRPLDLTRGDFNEDGRADLVTTYIGVGTARLSLRFAEEGGGFSEARFFDLAGSRPTALAVEDVNLDGHLDVVVAYDDVEAISLLEGTGTGSFGAVKEFVVGSSAQAAAAADFDKDGYVDVVIASAATRAIILLRGNETGFDSPVTLYAWPDGAVMEPLAMRAVDLDQDGLADMVLLQRQGLDVLFAAQAYEPISLASTDGEFTALVLGNFNTGQLLDVQPDDLTDLVVAEASGDLLVFLGRQAGGFLSPLTLSAGVQVKDLAVAHLDEDGLLDLVVVADGRDEVALLLGNGDGSFRAASNLRVRAPGKATAARLNQDALDDLVIAGQAGGSFSFALSAAAQMAVTTTRDAMDIPATAQVAQLPGPDGQVSLREAIVAANNTPGAQEIIFNIPRSDPGFNGTVFRLQPTSALPELGGGGTTINAWSQTLFTGDTNPAGPEVVLDGRNAGRVVDGLVVTSSLNVVQGLVVNNFSGNGVKIVGRAIQNVVVGNYIGTDETGTQARPNQFYGVIVGSNGSQSNLIGGTTPEDRNLISGNGSHGVALNFPTFDNRVVGNWIGTTASGTEALPNGGNGVFLSGVRENIIGGVTPGARNVISGNVRNGVSVDAGINNQIAGNYIGTDVTGSGALPNGHSGVVVSNGADSTLIGGVGALARNVISANMLHGVEVTSSSVSTNLQGNFIGTDKSGLVALGNGGSGVMINSTGNQVGGSISQARNVISSNGGDGIVVGRGSARNVIVGNFVGVAATSQEALPNGGNGLLLTDTTENTVGGPTPASANIISGNLGNGIGMLRASSNQIVGNFIGTDQTGSSGLGQGNDGLRLQDSVGNRIEANSISHSARAGISVLGSSSNNRISRNAIGDNGTLGIDLNGDGVSQNDSSDLDTGPNEMRNFPIITSVTAMGEGMMIQGFLPSLMPNLQTIEVFRARPDASGYGEGGQYLDQATPDADGHFAILMPRLPSESPQATALSNGDQLTATATDLQGNTSEFSPNFTIGIGDTLAPNVVLLSPNGGELIDAGETMTIRWRSFDNVGVVAQDVLLSTDGGQNFRPLRTNLAGVIQELQVQVPIVIDTAQAVICIVVRDGNGNQARDCSDDQFVIFGRDVFPPSVTLMSPNGGEIIAAGQPYTITWEASDDRPGVSCSVLLSVDGGSTYNTLASGLMGVQSYTWQVPAVLGATRARIRVVCRDSAGMTSQDESDATFAIDRSAPEVRVATPNGGDLIVRLGLPVHIQWTSSDDVAVASHDILISTDSGATFTPVVTNLPGTAQSYDWVLPRGLRTPKARIRIVTRDFVGRTSQDDSDRNFILIRL